MLKLTEKAKAIVHAMAGIEKQFGKGAIMRLGDAGEPAPVPVVSTGSLGLDLALGVGGLPRGRIVEIYGPESSGKTTLVRLLAGTRRAILQGCCRRCDGAGPDARQFRRLPRA